MTYKKIDNMMIMQSYMKIFIKSSKKDIQIRMIEQLKFSPEAIYRSWVCIIKKAVIEITFQLTIAKIDIVGKKLMAVKADLFPKKWLRVVDFSIDIILRAILQVGR